jgi:hypothetical protein
VAKLFGLNKQLARMHDLPSKMNRVLIFGRGSSLNSTIKLIDVNKYDLIILVNECDYLLENKLFKKIITSGKPIIQYLNNAEVVHSILKSIRLNLWGFWLSIPYENGLWRSGISQRRFRGPESLSGTPRYASIEMICLAEKYLPINAGLMCILQVIEFHNPQEIDLAGFDFYKNTNQIHVDNALLEKKEPLFLSGLSSQYEATYMSIIRDHPHVKFHLFT